MSYAEKTYAGKYVAAKGALKVLTADEWTDLNDMSEAVAAGIAGTVSNGSITDAKLATAVKVGDVASLNTTSKTNVVGAINEVDANADAAQAAVDAVEAIVGSTSLTTTAKTVTGAINELDAANSGMVTLTGTQVLTNKTMTSPVLNTAKIGDGDAGLTIISTDQTHASATATFPDIGDAADTVVMADTAQTLTNKTLETSCKIGDATDNTKDIDFSLSGATTGKTTTFTLAQTDDRIITFPDATCTLAAENRNPTLTLGAHDYDAGATAWTLSAAELLLKYHKPTNANAPVNAVVSTAVKEYVFINGTGQTLTVKTAAGTGVEIANSKAATVFCDGTNVVRVTADA